MDRHQISKIVSLWMMGLIILVACGPRPREIILPTRSDSSTGNIVIEITEPLSNAVLTLGPAHTIRARAVNSATGGGIVSIQFYADGRLIAHPSTVSARAMLTDQVSWTPFTAGRHTLQAVAINDRGTTTISDVQTVCVVRASVPAGTEFRSGRYEESDLGTLCDEYLPTPLGPADSAVTILPAVLTNNMMPECTGPSAEPPSYSSANLVRSIHDPGDRAILGLFTYHATGPSGPMSGSLITHVDPFSYGLEKTFWTIVYANSFVGGDYTFQALDRDGHVLVEGGPYPFPSLDCNNLTFEDGWGWRTVTPVAIPSGLLTSTPAFTPTATLFIPAFTNTAVSVPPTDTPKPPAPVDNDGDGWDSTKDCDDKDSKINPGATEIAGDGVDSNCNGKDDS